MAAPGFAVPDFRREERLAVLASLLLHALAALWLFGGPSQEEEIVIQRVMFEAPRPIMQKTFELAKRPEIPEVQMEMLKPAAMASSFGMSWDAVGGEGGGGGDGGLVGDALGGVGSGTGPGLGGGGGGGRPMAPAMQQVSMVEVSAVGTPRQEAVSLRHELLTVQDLDFGRYQAIIIQDPDNKRQVRGFFNMTVIDYDVADKNRDRFPTAVEELMRYMRDHTQINARIEGTTVELSDPRIMDAPFLYMTGWDATLQISAPEKKSLGEYLRHGGFLFAEDIRHASEGGGVEGTGAGVVGTPFDRQFKALLKDPLVLGSAGGDWEKVPHDHALYSCFWDFPDGPPLGGAPGGNVFDLEMLQLGGRVAVVFSDLNISYYWGDPQADARERGLQFGVNLVVFALTQPGGLANVTQYAR